MGISILYIQEDMKLLRLFSTCRINLWTKTSISNAKIKKSLINRTRENVCLFYKKDRVHWRNANSVFYLLDFFFWEYCMKIKSEEKSLREHRSWTHSARSKFQKNNETFFFVLFLNENFLFLFICNKIIAFSKK